MSVTGPTRPYARAMTSPRPEPSAVIRLLDLRETAARRRPRCSPRVDDPAAGGLNLFVGPVRDHDGGEDVDHLDYTAHPTALDRLREVADGVGRASST